MSNDKPSFPAQWQNTLTSDPEQHSQQLRSTVQSSSHRVSPSVSSLRGSRPAEKSDLQGSTQASSRHPSQTNSPQSGSSPLSPTPTTFPSLNTSDRAGPRGPVLSQRSSLPTASGLSQTGGQHQSSFPSARSVASPRSRALTPASTSSIGIPPGSGAGGGGGFIAVSRGGTYSPASFSQGHTSPTGTKPERSTSITALSPSSSQSSFSKISATQVILLLDTIGEKGGAAWETKAEKIQSLLQSNGKEVFLPFFRRALILSWNAVFGQPKDSDHGSYKLLQEQIQLVRENSTQAFNIAEAIDHAREDQFRDFDLEIFLQHFLSDPLDQVILAAAFISCNRPELQIKAKAFLSKTATSALSALSAPSQINLISNSSLALVLGYYALDRTLSSEERSVAFRTNIQHLEARLEDPEIMSAASLWRIPEGDRDLLDAFKKAGVKSTASKSAAQDVLTGIGRHPDEKEVANALLFMALAQPGQVYNGAELVSALQSFPIDWNIVLASFDHPSVRINTVSFCRLFDALLVAAKADPQFDIQRLWGGLWNHTHTQLSFLKAFMLAPYQDLLLDEVPNLRSPFDAADFGQLSDESREHIASLFDSQYRSLDAVRAIVEVVLVSDEIAEESEDGPAILHDLVQKHMDAFMLSLIRTPRPQGATREGFVDRCFMLYLEKQPENWKLVLESLYTQSVDHLYSLCTLSFHADPRRTALIYEQAGERGWMDTFLKQSSTPLGLDLACMRHKLRNDFDLEKYLADTIEPLSPAERIAYGNILWKYLRIKADDEFRVQREQIQPQSVPLCLKSVFTFLWKMQELVSDREQLKAAQTTCLQTYPRLMNFGTGFDHVLEMRSQELGNKLPAHIDAEMSELFGQMYRSEKSIRDMVTDMTRYKTSNNPEYQDLFCCIVHGLFDEYICYSEYPEEALEKTALLFGSIIRYKQLPAIPQEYGLMLIVDAVRENPPNSAMYRFGVEALLQINERLPEWPSVCRQLVSIQSLTEEAIREKALLGIAQDNSSRTSTSGLGNNASLVNGDGDDDVSDETARPFHSISAESPPPESHFRDPDEKSQEKILFVINNLSEDNMDAKLADLHHVLRTEHYQWFAAYLVEQRARLEPNNHVKYLNFLSKIDDAELDAEIVRETYVSVVQMLNARSTMDSSTERNHLKSLGTWLGSLTLARNKPVKHKNVYFVELLQEGLDTQRLIVVIPFTCKVLGQGAHSVVFRPPNPWLMEIIHLLMELYHFAELKLNEKFAIEVMCKELGLDHKKIEPATIIRNRPQEMDDALTTASGPVEAMDGFDESALNGPMSRGVRERISPEEILASFPSLSERLSFPQMQGRPQDQELIKEIITHAFEQAILEIIAPVVERSITIASISTAQLVSKDYSLEADPERYRTAAKQMVRSLAGSLALVTCKEPLRMSVSNYIRSSLSSNTQLSSDAMPSEGHIMMLLNDNLDKACAYVEKAAEDRALPEIEHVIEQDLEDRRRFAAENPGRDFMGPQLSRWSTFIPDPYKQTVGGLNEHQRAVYEDFSHRVHGMNAGHMQNASTDSTGRQIPDVLQETLAMPNISTPADQPAVPHQVSIAHSEPRSLSAVQQTRVNGYPDSLPPGDRVAMLIEEVQKAARSSEALRIKDMEKNSSIFQDVRQILIILTSSQRPVADHIARQIAEKICHTFITKPPQHPLEAELFAFLLNKLCMLSELIVRDVMRWITASEVELLHSSLVTAALVSVGLMDLARIDGVIASALKDRNEHGLRLLSELMDQVLFCEEPFALRADFANSIVALYGWLSEQPDLQLGVEISLKLKAEGVPEYVYVVLSDKAKAKQDQMQYVFKEWASLYENMSYNESAYATFLKGLHNDQLINSSEDLAIFFRLCIDQCIDGFEVEAQSFRGSLTAAFSRVDALSLLVILLIKFQGDGSNAVKRSKARYLESLLDTLVLVLNHHHEMRALAFNQRVFTRLLNSILFEYAAFQLDYDVDHRQMMLHFAQTLTELTPFLFPAFACGWMCLLSNRVLVEGVLMSEDRELATLYKGLLGTAFEFLNLLLEEEQLRSQADAIYRALLRTTFVLRQDYPAFVVQNHVFLCARISEKCPQLRNLILCARPSILTDEPDPLTSGLKVDLLEEMKTFPPVTEDLAKPLEKQGLLTTMQAMSRKTEDIDGAIKSVLDAVGPQVDQDLSPFRRLISDNELYECVIAWVINEATSKKEQFEADSVYARFVSRLLSSVDDQGRYKTITAVADHLRFANVQTEYALKLFLHIWSTASATAEESINREVLLRVIFERLVEPKPHPWGMLLAFKELSENQIYNFWETTGFESQPDLRQRLAAAVRGP